MTGNLRNVIVTLIGAGIACGSVSAATIYIQTNLASDVPGLAANLDPNLKNPWGMSFSATSPFWASDQATNKSTLYNAAGVPQALVVTTPASPTGQVFSNIAGQFLLPGQAPATFIFDSLSGTISGWNAAQGTTAAMMFTASDGATFTGLASGSSGGSNFLYASDFANGRIDAFNSGFAPVSLSGGFIDPTLPSGYAPYNIQNIGGKLYVEYAKVDPTTHRPTTTANTGAVSVFDLNGNFLQRLATNTHLDSPWGVTQAPATFGQFGGDILIGNFGDGTISAFNPVSGNFDGSISGPSGNALVNDGLWAINFRAPGSGFDPNTLFLNAGINGEADGLFAEIQVAPEPSAYLMMSLASIPLIWRKARRRG